ncbi:MAG: C40 family peptidase [Flavobacteriaceae bacterium]
MKIQRLVITISTFFIIILTGCKNESSSNVETVNTIISTIQQKYAPDKRAARFEAALVENGTDLIIKGITTNEKALVNFKEKMDSIGISFTDSLLLLPTADLKDKTGVINNSVSNIRSTKGDASEMATQALLGTPVKILQNIGGWYMVQTPDMYIGWIYQSEMDIKNTVDFDSWLSKPKVIITEMYTKSFQDDEENQPVSDLVAGDILALIEESPDNYTVMYPDGREAFIDKKHAQLYENWLTSLQTSQKTLVETSKQFLGLPYLWGGTSPKGVDCSGFTKSVYFLNGTIIPRDASQQVHEGELIDDKKDFSNLLPGDLLFFGRITPEGKENVVHVGMWIGNNEYIHASGRVKINSMDSTASNYDEYNYNRYLRTKRLLDKHTNGITYLKDKKLYTK